MLITCFYNGPHEIPESYKPIIASMIQAFIAEEIAISEKVLGIARIPLTYQSLESYFVPGSKILVAVENGVVLGYLSRFDTESATIIDTLYVAPQHRNRGIGSYLMESGIADAKTFVDVGVLAGNEPAEALYKKFGFVPFVKTLTRKVT